MKILNKYIFSFALIASVTTFAQETAEGEPTTIQSLLQLVEQGRTTEQGVNAKREADFCIDKKKQGANLWTHLVINSSTHRKNIKKSTVVQSIVSSN